MKRAQVCQNFLWKISKKDNLRFAFYLINIQVIEVILTNVSISCDGITKTGFIPLKNIVELFESRSYLFKDKWSDVVIVFFLALTVLFISFV